MADLDWWAPLGAAGELRVTELVADETLRNRALRTEDVRAIPLAELTLAGLDLTAEVGHRSYRLRAGDRSVVRFDVPERGPWHAQLDGEDLELWEGFVEVAGGDDRVDQAHVLRVSGRRGTWVLHFTGGRLSGDAVVLARGDRPGQSLPVVSCVPAPRSRALPKARRRRGPADVHVTTWTADATAGEVALVELVVLAGRHVGLDYLTAGLAGAARGVAGLWRAFTPVPDPLPTTKDR